MTIGPIAGAGAGASGVPAVAKPDTGDVAGVQDHDGDKEQAVAPASAASTTRPGRVDVKA